HRHRDPRHSGRTRDHRGGFARIVGSGDTGTAPAWRAQHRARTGRDPPVRRTGPARSLNLPQPGCRHRFPCPAGESWEHTLTTEAAMDPFLPAPQPIRWRRGVYAAALVIPFTVVQVWALLVLLSVADFSGLVAQAVLVLVLGSITALAVGW